jgi:DNA repair protein RecO (recombination protein O)
MAADAIADTILASHGGGGGWEAALSLAGASLDALEDADEGAAGRIFTQFLWNWADFLGLRPDLAEAERLGGDSPGGPLWFDRLEGGFTGYAPASGPGSRFLPLGPGARRWLLAAQGQGPAQLLRVSADPLSLAQARAAAAALMADIVGRELPTWNF